MKKNVTNVQPVLCNGKLTELHPGNGFLLNGRALVYDEYQNGNAIIKDTKQKDKIFVYGFEGLRRTLLQFGYDLKED